MTVKTARNSCLNAAGVLTLSLLATSVHAASHPQQVNDQSSDIQSALNKRLSPSKALLLRPQRYIITLSNEQAYDGGIGIDDGQAYSSSSQQSLTMSNVENVITSLGGTLNRVVAERNIVSATLDTFQLRTLRNMAGIANMEVDERRYIMAQSQPYGIGMVQAPRLPQSDKSAKKVCVIDTGYNYGHPDLGTSNVTGNANNSQVGNWYQDGNGHGTHVAGTIAALDNNTGVVGVYPGVDLHIVKIFNDSGNWTYASDLIAGVSQCQNAGAEVVNMSLGGGSPSTAENNAMEDFANAGILLVAAAGNDGNSTQSYPASYDAVMSVAAVDSQERHASYSQYNSPVEIAAPGSGVQSTYPTNTYASLNGTSMATPHVAGGAALVWSYFDQCSNEQIRAALNATAKDKGSAGRDIYYGHGILQVEDAYDYLNTQGCGGSGGNPGGVEPVSGQLTGLSGSRRNWARYTWDIPQGVSSMTISISGGSGDADLYLNYGSAPSLSDFDCRPYRSGNNETCQISNPQSGVWHIGIYAYSSYSNVTLNYSYE